MAADERSLTRRSMLIGVAGGLAALVVQALGRPLPAHAEGEIVFVGSEYSTATSRTRISNGTNNQNVIEGASAGGGTGVLGATATGVGVQGQGNSSGIGVAGSSASGYGAQFAGGKAPLRLLPKPAIGKPTSGLHQQGEFHVDGNGSLFICSAAGTPGTWRKVTTKLV